VSKIGLTTPEASVRQLSNLFSPDSFSNRELPEASPLMATASRRISLSIDVRAWYDCVVGSRRTGESEDGSPRSSWSSLMKRLDSAARKACHGGNKV
jgi:hypothetical protein